MGIVYKITNTVNQKVYIGKTIGTFERRMSEHKSDAKVGKNTYFHRAIRKYGWEAFTREIIAEHEDEEVLSALERLNIFMYNSFENGYNLTEGGEGTSGWKHTDEARLKISKANKGKEISDEHRKTLSNKFNGENNPNYGNKHSDEVKKKMSEAKTGENHPNYGKKFSREYCKKLSKSQPTRGLFGFRGARYLNKKINPWRRVWNLEYSHKGRKKSLGVYEDPKSCEIVYNLVWNEIYGDD